MKSSGMRQSQPEQLYQHSKAMWWFKYFNGFYNYSLQLFCNTSYVLYSELPISICIVEQKRTFTHSLRSAGTLTLRQYHHHLRFWIA